MARTAMELTFVVFLVGFGCIPRAYAIDPLDLPGFVAKFAIADFAAEIAPVVLERSVFYPTLAKVLKKLYPDDSLFAINAKLAALHSVTTPIAEIAGKHLAGRTIDVVRSLRSGKIAVRNATYDVVLGVPGFMRTVAKAYVTRIAFSAVKPTLSGPGQRLSKAITIQAEGALLHQPQAMRRLESLSNKFLGQPEVVRRAVKFVGGEMAQHAALAYYFLLADRKPLSEGIGLLSSALIWNSALHVWTMPWRNSPRRGPGCWPRSYTYHNLSSKVSRTSLHMLSSLVSSSTRSVE